MPVDRALLVRRLRRRWRCASAVPAPYYRLVYGESDRLPGLVLDRYGDVLVGQIATAGMEAHARRRRGGRGRRCSRRRRWSGRTTAARASSSSCRRQIVCRHRHGAGGTARSIEAGLQFRVPLAGGQKTGWFFDQAANRAQLPAALCAGARVLDVCSYAGAWAITALRGRRREAACVDSSAAALAVAQRNAARQRR